MVEQDRVFIARLHNSSLVPPQKRDVSLEVNTRWESHTESQKRSDSVSECVCVRTMTLYVRKASSRVTHVLLNAKTDMLDDVLLGQRPR